MTRRCYITSDLHMGAGLGDVLDTFKDDAVFARWMASKNADASETTLVLNGDIVDFALIKPWKPADGLPSYLLWTEDDSVAKLEAAIAGHAEFFDALAHFHLAGGTIVIIVGNHDLDWIWPGVQRTLAARVGAVPTGDTSFDRLVVEPIGMAFANVWIEHGHRFTGENAPENPNDPDSWIHEYEGAEYLERVWGTDFLISFFNDKHESYPWLSHVKPTLKVVMHGLRAGWFSFRDGLRMLAFLTRSGIPVGDIIDFTLPGNQEVHVDSLLRKVLDEELREALRQAAASEGITSISLSDSGLDGELAENLLSGGNLEIRSHDFGAGSEFAPAVADAAPDSDTLGLFRDSRELRHARDLIDEHGYHHIVYGHTHVIEGGLDIYDDEDASAQLFNPGSWIPFLDLRKGDAQAVVADTGINVGLLQSEKYYTKEFAAIEILDTADGPQVSLEQIG